MPQKMAWLDHPDQQTEGLSEDSMRGSEQFIPGFGQRLDAIPPQSTVTPESLASAAVVDPRLGDEARARGGSLVQADFEKLIAENEALKARLEARDRALQMIDEADRTTARAEENRPPNTVPLSETNPASVSEPATPVNPPVVDEGNAP